MVMPFRKPFMPQTHTFPSFRLGPDFPRCEREPDRIVAAWPEALKRETKYCHYYLYCNRFA